MNKSELVTIVSSNGGVSKADAERAVDCLLAAITDALKRGDDVRLTGFGTFSVADRAASKGRNPKTGAIINVPASRRARFKAGAALRAAIN